MKFTQKLSNIDLGKFHLTEILENIIYYKDFKGDCVMCGAKTNFMEINFNAWICSEECQNETYKKVEEKFGDISGLK